MSKDFVDIQKVIRQGMEAYLQERGFPSLENANKKQRAKALLEYYTKDIGAYLYQFDEDQIDEGLRCDGSSDLNIDFVYKHEDTFYIIQSKYKRSGCLERDEVSGFFKIHSRILDKEFFEMNANDTVRDILSNFKKTSPVHYILLTNCQITDTIRSQFNKELQDEQKHYKTPQISWELKGLTEIKQDYKTALSSDEPIPEKVVIPIERITNHFTDKKEWSYLDLTNILDDDLPYQTILCTVKGIVLKELYKHHKERLFNYNIRGYLGQNVINKRIINTIEEDPKSFYLYNNGISAICSNLFPEETSGGHGLQIVCDNFQIINGAQTTSCIGKFRDDSKLRDVRVLLKITKSADIKKESKSLNRKIITNNNSQTVIKASDFRSNDEIQIFLEKKISTYHYKVTPPFKKIIYMPKRKKISKRSDEVFINMESLAKILFAFHYTPYPIYANSNILFDTDSSTNGKYWDIFGDNGEEVSFWPEEKVKEAVAISIIWLYVSEKLKTKAKELTLQKKEGTIDYLACLAKWHYLWAYGDLIKRLYTDKMTWIVNRVIDGKLFSKENNFIDIWFEGITEKISDVLDSAYQDSKDEEDSNEAVSKGFQFKNWLRNQKAFEKLRSKFKRASTTTFPLDKAE